MAVMNSAPKSANCASSPGVVSQEAVGDGLQRRIAGFGEQLHAAAIFQIHQPQQRIPQRTAHHQRTVIVHHQHEIVAEQGRQAFALGRSSAMPSEGRGRRRCVCRMTCRRD